MSSLGKLRRFLCALTSRLWDNEVLKSHVMALCISFLFADAFFTQKKNKRNQVVDETFHYKAEMTTVKRGRRQAVSVAAEYVILFILCYFFISNWFSQF